ncbi:DUF3040 domain-containing protein [Leucobacter sp. W1153]|uniref:DUF3040 domain-containing protein n=1 Tax=unclassified Leucobacter TaxID=2621730 RepID=UPI003F3FB46E
MGLSEHEQQLLDEMERRLYQSEADVMQTAQGAHAQFNLRSLVLGIVVGLVGIGVLVGGVAAQQLWLGVIGFAVMLSGALLAFSKREAAEPERSSSASVGGSATPASAQKESFSDRMQRRWDERMEGER